MPVVSSRLSLRRTGRRSLVAAAASAIGVLALGPGASAQQYNAGVNGLWSNGTNWSSSPAAPTSGATTALTFLGSAAQTYTATNDNAGTFQLNSLTFNSTSSQPIFVAGNPLNLTQDGSSNNPQIVQSGTGLGFLLNSFTATDPLTLNGAGTGTLIVAGAITNTGGITVNNSSFDVVQGVTSVMSGGGALNKSGTGVLTLLGVNTFTGAINLSGGTLRIIGPGGTTDAAALGASPKLTTLTNGATFNVVGAIFDPNSATKSFSIGTGGGAFETGFNAAFTLDALNLLQGSGDLSKTGRGIMTLGSDFSTGGTPYSGTISVRNGLLRVATNIGALGSGASAIVATDTTGGLTTAGSLDVNITGVTKPLTISGTGNPSPVSGLNFVGGAVTNTSATVLTYAGPITVAGATAASVGGNGAGGITFSNVITSTVGIIKTGTGPVTFSGANVITGSTAVESGTLTLNYATQLNDKVDPASPMIFRNSPVLTLSGNTAAFTQIVNGLTLNSGLATITATNGTGTLTFDTRGASGLTPITVNQGAANFGGTGSILVANTNNAAGILGGWALFGTAAGGGWAANDGTGKVIALAPAGYTADTFGANVNTDVIAAALAPAAGTTTETIRFNTNTANTTTLGGALTLNSGGIVVTAANTSAVNTITGGSIIGPAGGNIYVHHNGAAAATLTISSVIGGGANNFGVVKTGGGVLVLNAASTFTGGVFVGGGTVQGINSRSFGALTSVITLGSGGPLLQLRGTGGVNFDNPVVVSSSMSAAATINVDRSSGTTTGAAHRLGDLTIGSNRLIITTGNSFTLNFNGATTLVGNPIFENGTTLTLTGVVSDSTNVFSITKQGTATLILNAANTYDGGTFVTAGTIRGVTNTSYGTGAVTITGGTIQDNAAARTYANPLNVLGSFTFGAQTAGVGSLAWTGPVSLQVANPTLTISTPTTLSGPVSGANLTVAGTLMLTLSGANTYTGTTTVNSGVLQFNQPSSIGGVGASVTPNATGTVAAGYAIDQPFLNRIAPASAGVAALGIDSANSLDFTGFTTLRLGAVGVRTYAGALIPAGTAYRLGGGTSGAILTVDSLLSGSRQVDIGGNGTTGTDVVLNNVANTFAGVAGDNVNAISVVSGGSLRLLFADGVSGAGASRLGPVPNAPTANIELSGGGIIEYGAAAATLNVNRSITLGTGGGTIDAGGNNVSMSNAFLGSGGLIKSGLGTLTLPIAGQLPSTNALSVVGATTTAVNTLDFSGNSQTLTGLTVNGAPNPDSSAPAYSTVALPTTYYGILTNIRDLTVNGPVTIGADSSGVVRINQDGVVNFGNATSNVVLGVKTVNAPSANARLQFGVLDATRASAVGITGSNVILGGNGAAPHLAGTLDGGQSGLLLLPTAIGVPSTISVATGGTLLIGGSSNQGSYVSGRLVAGGTLTITAPTMILGGQKASGIFAFNNGAATPVYNSGAVLRLGGVSGGRVNIDLGRNTTPGTNTVLGTGSTPLSVFETIGGSIVGPGGAGTFAQVGTVRLGFWDNGGSTTNAGSGTGVFVVDGASSLVDINAFTLAAVGFSTGTTAPSAPRNTRGIIVVNNGLVRLNGAITVANGVGAGTALIGSSQLNVLGGTLDMQGNNIASAANPLNGINSATPDRGLNLTGGTILNAATIGVGAASADFNHSGGTLSRTSAGTTAITGPWTVSTTAPQSVATPATILVSVPTYSPALGFAGVGGGIVRLDATGGGGARAVTASSLARAGTGTLNIVPVSGSLGINETVTFTTTPATIATSTATPMVAPYVVAQASGVSLAGDYLTHGGGGLVPLTYSASTDLNAAGATHVFNATGATTNTLTAASAVLALRAGAPVDLGTFTLTVGSGIAASQSGVLMNGISITGGTLAFGAGEAVIYSGGGSTNTLASNITGTGGLTIFGNSPVSVTVANAGLTGAVFIGGGTLAINNTTGSATGTGAVTVGSNGTLGGGASTGAGSFTAGGTGFLTGAVTVNRFGRVAPGNSVGTVHTGAMTLAGGSILNFEIDPTVLTQRLGATPTDVNTNDRIDITGAVNVAGAVNFNPITLNVDGGGGAYDPEKTYDFFLTRSTSITGFNAAGFTIVPTNFGVPFNYSLSQVGTTNLVLTLTPIPEPATAGLLAMAGMGLLARRRSRRGD